MLETTAASSECLHCGQPVAGGEPFCCRGCESVHSLLIRRGLSHFYEMRGQGPATLPRPAPNPLPAAGPVPIPASQLEARFYIEGIHCLGCLWLLEKLPQIDDRIEVSSLDYAHGILQIRKSAAIGWDEACQLIRELGYSPQPLAEDEGAATRQREMRAQAVRLGVAAFSAGNIMLLTVSGYAGAGGNLAKTFQWLSMALSLPALLYSAFPLYVSAWKPLRHGKVSVDLAVTMAVITGFALSLFNLAAGRGEDTYFDSLTMLVFLLLTSRYFLSRFRESIAKEAAYLSFLSSELYERSGPESGAVAASAIREGDQILLRGGQTLPADSRLDCQEAYFDYALLTGESAPVKLQRGDAVDAGARLLDSSAKFRVSRDAEHSRLAKILGQIRTFQLSKSPSLDFADRIGRRFVFVVLGLAAALVIALPYPEGLHRALVLIIVTCPCVLAFAVPLAFTRTLQQAARAGILFRASDKIETLAAAKTAFLDKTGTLTEGNFEVLAWQQIAGEEKECRSAVLALEETSSHPVAKALVRYLTGAAPVALTNAEEKAGTGVSGTIDGRHWAVAKTDSAGSPDNVVGVFREGVLAAKISLGDRVRPEAARFVRELVAEGLEPVILSGDSEARVRALASTLGISKWRARLAPEEKAEIARAERSSLMVGDGANDAVAFQAANVGIAVSGAMDLSLKNADIALASPGLDGVLRAVRTAKRAMRIVRTNFAISLAYNLAAGALAVSGAMSPLFAAALMPLSALSVFGFTQVATNEKLA